MFGIRALECMNLIAGASVIRNMVQVTWKVGGAQKAQHLSQGLANTDHAKAPLCWRSNHFRADLACPA